MLECEIDDHITLKLKGERTLIYVDGKKFDQCRRLLIHIHKSEISDYDTVESIDDASEVYKKKEEKDKEGRIIVKIPPKDEFWGHSSNFQWWVETNYNYRVLHSNLSLPLLRKLTQLGNPLAKASFKEAIKDRFVKGSENVVRYFINEDYLSLFGKDEIETMLAEFEQNMSGDLIDEMWNNIGKDFLLRSNNLDYGLDFAIDAFKKSLSGNPTKPYVWNNLASAHFLKKDYQGVVSALKESLHLDPFNKISWRVLSFAYKCLGKDKKSNQALDKYT